MALPIIGILGGIGTLIAATTPIITKLITGKSTNTLELVESQENKIQKDIQEKFIKMEDSLRRALYTKYSIEVELPEALKTRTEGKITNIDDIYTKLPELLNTDDIYLKNIIFQEFNGFLKYRKPYLRIMKNYLDLFKRLNSLKEQILKLIDEAKKINLQKLDIPPEQEKIRGGDYPTFIKSEISILYEEFMKGYADYNQYVDRLSNFFKLIKGRGFNELDVFKVSRTDISDYIGEDKGVLVWSTKDNVNEGIKIIDELEKNSPTISFCLSSYNSIIDTWLGQLKSNKGVVVTSLRPIIENEKKQITDIIAENTIITSDLVALKNNLEDYKEKDKLEDAKLALQNLKAKQKRFKSVNDKIDILESRLNNYANTIRNSREANLSFQKCLRTADFKQSSDTSSIPSIPSGTSGTSGTTQAALQRPASQDILYKLNSIDFTSATDKDEAMQRIEAFKQILNDDLSNYLTKVYDDYEMVKKMSLMISSAQDLFGPNKNTLFGVIDPRPINTIINKVVKN